MSDKFDTLLEAIGGEQLDEAITPKAKQLHAKLESFGDMVRMHMKDLNDASKYMKQIDPVLRRAFVSGNRDVIEEAIDVMEKVNKDLNECHLPLNSVKDELHRCLAVDLPDWKKKV